MAEEKKEKKKRKRPDRSLAQKIVPDEKVAAKINKLHAILWEYPPVDINDVEEVNERTILFFQLCDEIGVKALWETYAFALGYSVQSLSNYIHCRPKPASHDILVRSKNRLLSDLVQLTASGQVNPIPAIFLLKNNFGYTDKMEITTTATDPLGEQKSIAEIKQRLIASVPIDDVVEDAEFVEVKPKELVAPPEK